MAILLLLFVYLLNDKEVLQQPLIQRSPIPLALILHIVKVPDVSHFNKNVENE